MMPASLARPAVMLVLDKMIRAGTQRHVLHTLRFLGGSYRFHVVCLEGPGPWDAEVIREGAVLHRYAMNRIYDPGGLETLGGLRRLVRQVRPVGIEALMFTAHLAAALASQGVPLVSSPREKCLWRKGRHLILKKLANSRVRLHIANSRAVADDLKMREGVPEGEIRQVPNSLDPSDFKSVSDALEPIPGKTNAVVIAALKEVKQHGLLLEALALSPLLKSKLAVTLYGDGPLRETLESRSLGLGLGDVVRFGGGVEDAPGRLRGYDFCIHPSRSEAMSNAVLEGMASGLPPVAFASDGNVECVEDGVTGLLLKAQDAPTMAAGLERMVEDTELRRRMGQEAKKVAWERHAPEVMQRAKLAVYREAFGC